MPALQNKIDFAVVFTVNKANPNGDPINGNRPRQDFMGHGEVSDVALKRKIRNRMQDKGIPVLVQSDDKRSDSCRSIKDRAESVNELGKLLGKKNATNDDEQNAITIATNTWYDVRAFGQVFAFKGADMSLSVRGPVSIHTATSTEPVDVTSMQITKSVNATTNTKDPSQKTSDTMGEKHRVDFGVYVFYGSINPQLAEKTGFTYEDAQELKDVLKTLFANDVSSARPDGSMEVNRVFWWEHSSRLGDYSSAKVHRSVRINKTDEDAGNAAPSIEHYTIRADNLDGLHTEEHEGL